MHHPHILPRSKISKVRVTLGQFLRSISRAFAPIYYVFCHFQLFSLLYDQSYQKNADEYTRHITCITHIFGTKYISLSASSLSFTYVLFQFQLLCFCFSFVFNSIFDLSVCLNFSLFLLHAIKYQGEEKVLHKKIEFS